MLATSRGLNVSGDTLTMTIVTVTGGLIVVGIAWVGTNGAVTIGDTLGDMYMLAAMPTASNNLRITMYWAIAKAATTTNLTVTIAGAQTELSVDVGVYSGPTFSLTGQTCGEASGSTTASLFLPASTGDLAILGLASTKAANSAAGFARDVDVPGTMIATADLSSKTAPGGIEHGTTTLSAAGGWVECGLDFRLQ
jgi:hypothetical protein